MFIHWQKIVKVRQLPLEAALERDGYKTQHSDTPISNELLKAVRSSKFESNSDILFQARESNTKQCR